MPNNSEIDSLNEKVEGSSLTVRWTMFIASKTFRCLFFLAFLLLVVLVPSSNAQLAVRGTVIDGETNQPFPGVTVSARGTTLGTTTAADGTFSLQVPFGDVTLVFSFVGYRTQEVNVSASGEEIDVVLHSDVFGLDEFVVVGSRRQPRLLKDSAVPVDVLGPSDLHSMGSTDVDDVVRTQIPSYNLQALNGDEAAIVRPATLRGLPTDNVIVLVNGKRRHRSGSIALSAGSLNEGAQGPDLNMIPTIALRQIEVLRDGATAQYGADAVAGVFNLQLREDAQGVRARLRTGQYLKGDGRYVHAAANAGFSLPRNGFANLSLEYRDVEPTVLSAQRDDALTLTRRGYPVADPAQIWGNAEVSHSIVGFLNSSFDVTPGIRGYVFGGGGRRTQESGFYFRSPGTETARSSVFRFGGERAVLDLKPDSGVDCHGEKTLPGLDATNAEIQGFIDEFHGECFLFNEIFPGGFTPRFGGDVFDISLTAGLRNSKNDGLNWDVSVSGARSLLDFFIYRTVNASYGPDTPTSFKPRSYLQQEAEVSAAFSLPLAVHRLATPIHLAWGATWRTEIFESRPGDPRSWKAGPYADQGFSVGSNGYQGLNPDFAGRWARPNFAVYVDAEADLTRRLLGNIAVRYENFTTEFGSTLNGKLAALYRVTNRISLRATTSTGFRAPTPGQANLNVFRTTGFSKEHGLIEVGVLPSVHPISEALGGKPLTPELANSVSSGVIAEISEDITLTADYFRINVRDRLSLTGNIPLTDEIVQIVDSKNILGGVTNIREVRFYSNDFSTQTNGLDVLLAWQREWESTRAISGSIAWNWTAISLTHFTPQSEITSFLGQTLRDPLTLGLLTKRRQVEIEELNPKHRLVATQRYLLDRWSALFRVSWFDSWQACRFASSTCTEDGISVLDYFPSVWLTDVELGYTFRDFSQVTFGVNNLFDVARSAHTEETHRQGNLTPRSTPFDHNGTSVYLRITTELY